MRLSCPDRQPHACYCCRQLCGRLGRRHVPGGLRAARCQQRVALRRLQRRAVSAVCFTGAASSAVLCVNIKSAQAVHTRMHAGWSPPHVASNGAVLACTHAHVGAAACSLIAHTLSMDACVCAHACAATACALRATGRPKPARSSCAAAAPPSQAAPSSSTTRPAKEVRRCMHGHPVSAALPPCCWSYPRLARGARMHMHGPCISWCMWARACGRVCHSLGHALYTLL